MTTIDAHIYGMGTGLTVRYPWGTYVAGAAMCADGKVRPLARIAATADTFFSVPASVRVYKDGKAYTVSGYITTECASGSSVHIDDTDPIVVKFVRYNYGKNAAQLPEGKWTA